MHGSPIPHIISESAFELLGALDAIGITDQGVSATEKLSHGGAISKGWGIREDCVSCNSFVLLRDVEERIFGFRMLLEIVLGGSSRAISCGDLEDVSMEGMGAQLKYGWRAAQSTSDGRESWGENFQDVELMVKVEVSLWSGKSKVVLRGAMILWLRSPWASKRGS